MTHDALNQPPPTPPAAKPKRSALRFVPLGLATWLVLEIWLLTVVASHTSGFVVFLLLLAGVLLGAVVIKRAGRRAFKALNEAVRQAQSGGAAGLDAGAATTGGGNALTMLGGLLLILPGLISDAVGLLLLLPPTRALISAYTVRTVEKRVRAASAGRLGDAFQQARIHRPDGKVVPGEVIRDEPGRGGETPGSRPSIQG